MQLVINILKAHVEGHYKTTSTGKRVFVKEHEDTRKNATQKLDMSKRVTIKGKEITVKFFREMKGGKVTGHIMEHDGKQTKLDEKQYYAYKEQIGKL